MVVGQPRAAPPAIDRVMVAEVFLVCEDRLAELGEREPAPLVCFEPIPSGSPSRSTRSSSSRPATAGRGPCASPSSREPISKSLNTRASGGVPGDETAHSCQITVAISSSSRISVAPSPVVPEGSSSSRSSNAGRNSGNALKSPRSRSKQASGVVARYACQAALAVSSRPPGDVDDRHMLLSVPSLIRHDQIEVRQGAISTWPLSPDKTENNRAARSVAIDHSGPDRTIAR